jgi:hypothetical protein
MPGHHIRAPRAVGQFESRRVELADYQAYHPGMVLRWLREQRDVWRARKFWRLRLALSTLCFVVILALFKTQDALTHRSFYYVFLPAVFLPMAVDWAFWRSDKRAERARKARHGSARTLARP